VKGSVGMVIDAAQNSLDETDQSTITIKSVGRRATIHWQIAGFLEDFVVIDKSLFEQHGVELKLIVLPKSTPTSASPQG
jgi:hypothetical protein